MRFAGSILLGFAGLSFGAAAVCALLVPDAVLGRLREPEDVFGVYGWLAISLLLGSSLLLAGLAAVRGQLLGAPLHLACVSVLSALAVLFAVFAVAEIVFDEFATDWPLGLLISAVSSVGAATMFIQARRSQRSAGQAAQ